MKGPFSNTRQVLGTIQPHDGKVALRCSVRDAETQWFTHVSRYDRHHFELVAEPAPHGCNVSVRPWSESGMLTGGAPAWAEWLLVAVLLLIVVVVLNYV